jgi:competence protein ComFB
MDEVLTKEKKQYLLVNITEELVKRKVKKMMADTDMCQCEKCYLDVCAIVLNRLQALYVTTEKGALLSLLDASHYQYKIDLTVYIMQAMEKTKKSPKH